MLHPHVTLPTPTGGNHRSHFTYEEMEAREVVRHAQDTHTGKWALGGLTQSFILPLLLHSYPQDSQSIPLLMPRVESLGPSLLSASPTLISGRKQEIPSAQYLLLRLEYSLQSQHGNLTSSPQPAGE